MVHPALLAAQDLPTLERVTRIGKSPGEVAFLWRERRALIVGDAVIGNPPGHVSLLRESVMDDPPRLRRSVQQLLALDFDTILVGDGVSVIGNAKQRLRELVDSFPK
jgi:glyoxylase-like metal-dependent hydrolase (beta-lactamase superfamily II)